MKKTFAEDEVQSFITVGKQLASKTVLSMLISVINEGPDEGRSAQLAAEVASRMPFKYSGYLQCEFDEISHKLNISLSLVDRDYRTDIDIPDARYAGDLYKKYNFLKDTAAAFWRQFVEEQPELVRRIGEYRTGVDFAALVVDPANPTVMYFDAASAKRVGIFCYYVDSNNQPFYKNVGR